MGAFYAGLLVQEGTYRHTFPFCWRCGSPLLYYAKPSWFIATTRVRDEMMAQNSTRRETKAWG